MDESCLGEPVDSQEIQNTSTHVRSPKTVECTGRSNSSRIPRRGKNKTPKAHRGTGTIVHGRHLVKPFCKTSERNPLYNVRSAQVQNAQPTEGASRMNSSGG